MYKIFFCLFLLVGVVDAKTHVLVSIAPQKFLVERIGDEYVSVDVLVPPGASSHSYEPSPKQIIAAQNGEIWFRIGESFETRIISSLKDVLIVDQREGIDLIDSGCHCHDSHDPHIWLSPKLLKRQAAQIADALCQKDPEHASCFNGNLQILWEELDQLHEEICEKCLEKKVILVSHPAFGYFCRDYGLKQLSIEMEGREPTPKYLATLMHKAESSKISTVFLQKQHHAKGGKRMATALGAETVFVDPYVENVIENLRSISNDFSRA